MPGQQHDLMVTLDGAIGAIYSAFLVDEEDTMSSFAGVAEVISEFKTPRWRGAVLFFCTDNVCRSLIAEGVFRTFLAYAGAFGRAAIDSAGTRDYELGPPPTGFPAGVRQVGAKDFVRFDWTLAMDTYSLRELQML